MRIRVLALGLALAMLCVIPNEARAQSIFVSPTAGSQADLFTFSGGGFAPNTPLAFLFTSPDGTKFELKTSNGAPAVWVTDGNGDFSFAVLPAVDFAGGAPGVWSSEVCVEETQECWAGSFEIAL